MDNQLNPVKRMETTDFTRIANDINGNARYVCHFSHLLPTNNGLQVSERYDQAVKAAKQLGGKRYHTKAYGGGIVFQSSNLTSLVASINALYK